ncbi:hypothetical protein C7974DRAFT_178145 [Boeremia exigua]|uniref:uncharacterized protein n=1 Tax=Boeremia exigua TaxID=749465 RepID=UPI001E8DF365|nr:uncharacterized protein C7974DRAFT_178145 [Boeremia exigua]KAH6633798.1 hypothetical protein C7974DRAFT_178145 [Boeremia exigua]
MCAFLETLLVKLHTPPSSRRSHTQQSYQHSPLHPTSKEFRLLRFCCKDISECSEVKCELRIFDLKWMGRWSGAPAQYTALSYTWGTSLSRSRLMIDGAYLEIGPNLYAFCKEFCRSQVFEGAESKLLWLTAFEASHFSTASRPSQQASVKIPETRLSA